MVGILSNVNSKSDPLAMLTGVLCVLFSALFFLQKFNMINLSFEIMDTTYLYLFAGLTMLAGITILLVSLGLLGVR
jgi:glucan phosphoethanolaminetransferase (alkaline phosphatase superfamily)